MSGLERQRARRTTLPGEPPLARALGATALTAGAGASLAGLALAGARRARRGRPAPARLGAGREVSGLYAAAALLALSVLADSGLEHFRGDYRNPGMYTPLAVSAATLALAAQAAGRPERSRRGAGLVFATATAVGAGGVAFHVFNIRKRPGRFNWINLFYAAPLGAPAALSLAGLFGLAAHCIAAGRRRLAGLSAGRALCGLAAGALAGTVGEAGLLHFRGAFQNPFMWLPVSLPPVAAVLLGRAALDPRPGRRRPLARAWLALTAALGVGGVGFHVFGVSRAMGGWRNWRQNLIDGPPIPAPPAFSALALAGLTALRIREMEALA